VITTLKNSNKQTFKSIMFKLSQADSPIHLVPWRLRCCQCMLTGN